MGCHFAMAAEKEWPVEIVFFPEPQPVEVPEKMCDVVVLLRTTDQTCRSIKHGL